MRRALPCTPSCTVKLLFSTGRTDRLRTLKRCPPCKRRIYCSIAYRLMHALSVITGNSEADNATAAALWANHQPSLHPAEPPPPHHVQQQ